MNLKASDPQSWVGKKLKFSTNRTSRTQKSKVDPSWGLPPQGMKSIVKGPDTTTEFIVLDIIDQSQPQKLKGNHPLMGSTYKIETDYSQTVKLVKVKDMENGVISVFPIGYIAAGIDSGSIQVAESRSGSLMSVLECFQK